MDMHINGHAQGITSTPRIVDALRTENLPDLIIFDCDGVLVQSEEITLSVLADLFNAHLLDKRPERSPLAINDCIQRFRGRKINTCLDELQDEYSTVLPLYFETVFRAQALSLYKTDLQATEGIIDLVSSLNTRLCVASSAPRSKVEQCLKLTRLWPWFEGKVFSCYDVGTWKPDPLVFQTACRSNGVNPDRALVIEDSIAGVQAAVAAGIRVLGFGPPDRHPELKDAGATTFSRMNQLHGLMA
jgi:HAD superfamily hydrolase (TIGR01509 family)